MRLLTRVFAAVFFGLACVCARAGASTTPFAQALDAARGKARSAFIAGAPLDAAVSAEDVERLQGLAQAADPGAPQTPGQKSDALSAFLGTLEEGQFVQRTAPERGTAAYDADRMVQQLQAASQGLGVTGADFNACLRLYLKSGGGPAASGGAPLSADERGRLSKDSADALAAATRGAGGWTTAEAGTLPAGTPSGSATGAAPGGAGPALPAGAPDRSYPTPGPKTLRIDPVPAASSGGPTDFAALRRGLERRQAAQLSAAAGAQIRDNGVGWAGDVHSYWRDRANPDIQPGESAAHYVFRMTTSKLALWGTDPFYAVADASARAGSVMGNVQAGRRAKALAVANMAVTFGASTLDLATLKPGGFALKGTAKVAGAEAAEDSAGMAVGDLDHGAGAATAPADAFGTKARAGYTVARSRPEALTVDARTRIGPDYSQVDPQVLAAKQTGQTCVGHAACAVANANGTQASLAQTLASRDAQVAARAQETLGSMGELRLGDLPPELRAKMTDKIVRATRALAQPSGAGLSNADTLAFIERAGLKAQPLGDCTRLMPAVEKGGDPAAFLKESAGIKRGIDAQLLKGRAVMAEIYTGQKATGHGFHAVAVLGRGRTQLGEIVYEVYDSNAGRVLTYPVEDFHAFMAVVVN